MKLSDRQFAFFKKRVLFWIDALDLNEWMVFIKKTGGMKDDDACVEVDLPAMRAHITIRSDADVVDDEWFEDCAQHEVVELLLIQLQTMAESRGWSQSKFQSEVHSVVHRIQKLMRKIK